MNQDQIAGVLRILVPAICTWLAAKGLSAFGDAGLVAQVTAVAIGVAAIAWSFVSHTDSNKLRTAAKVDPGVEIRVPSALMAENTRIRDLVHDDNVPNVNGPM